MDMEKNYTPMSDVAELMVTYEQAMPDSPTIPSREILLLRARLVIEEALEFVKAAGCSVRFDSYIEPDGRIRKEAVVSVDEKVTPNLVEMVGGLGDILVVTYGSAAALGVNMQPVWNEIQRSNLSKGINCCSVCGAEVTAWRGDHGELYGYSHPFQTNDERHVEGFVAVHKVIKREDGKGLKPTSYIPPDIAGVLAKQSKG